MDDPANDDSHPAEDSTTASPESTAAVVAESNQKLLGLLGERAHAAYARHLTECPCRDPAGHILATRTDPPQLRVIEGGKSA